MENKEEASFVFLFLTFVPNMDHLMKELSLRLVLSCHRTENRGTDITLFTIFCNISCYLVGK